MNIPAFRHPPARIERGVSLHSIVYSSLPPNTPIDFVPVTANMNAGGLGIRDGDMLIIAPDRGCDDPEALVITRHGTRHDIRKRKAGPMTPKLQVVGKPVTIVGRVVGILFGCGRLCIRHRSLVDE